MAATADIASGRPGPRLSILIPVYNVSAHVEACLLSVLGQQAIGNAVEVLVLDDASSDDSWTKVERIAAQYPDRFRLLRHPRNRGLSVARNTLLAHATGDYVWHLDSDDLMLPGAIKRLLGVIEASAPDLVMCGFRVLHDRQDWRRRLVAARLHRSFDGDTGRLCSDRSQLVAGLMRVRCLHAWTKIARREVWLQARFPEGRALMQDAAVMPGLIAATRAYLHVGEAWVGYRQHGASALASSGPSRIPHALETLRDLKSGMAALRPLDREAEFSVDYFLLRTMGWIARKLPAAHGDDNLDGACRSALNELLPDGGARVIEGCRRRYWYMRARRMQRSLRMRGWI